MGTLISYARAVIVIGHFGKYHNTLCLSPQTLHEHCFQFLFGLTMSQEKIKTMLMQNLGGQRKSIMVFSETAYCNERNWTLHLGLFWTNVTLFSYWVRSNVSLYKASQAAVISSFFISPTHPTHTWRDPPHRELRPLLFFDICMGTFTSPANHETVTMQETGPTI